MVTVVSVTSADSVARRKKFLEFLFDRTEGTYVCIARRQGTSKFEERFFLWPNDEQAALDYIEQSVSSHNVWFCPMTFRRPNRSKFDVVTCPAIWSDLDFCPPESLLVPPTLLLETSNGRHQGLWCLTELAEPLEAEEISKAIAYRHADEGADKSGWDLTQLLRMPLTLNMKYDPADTVKMVSAADVVTIEHMREMYPQTSEDASAMFPYPQDVPNGEALLQAYRNNFDSKVWMLLKVTPEADWSKALWQLEMLLAESGLSREDMFAVARTAACNKYLRDGRSDTLLWREVCKAWLKHRDRNLIIQDTTVFKTPDLLSEEDMRAVEADRTFIDDYVDWAKGTGDAAEVYHHAGAFTILSALMSGSVQLPTSFGTMVPNLWFLLLADTTLTRKSTALDLAVDMLVEIDPSLIMATDGSIEGMFTGLSLRPGMPSIFLRDEFSGLIEMMTKRDYYAGMAETLTKMYDGKMQKRILRRETIEVKDPILIIFAGGIRTKILSLLTPEQVTSGFLPRFIFVSGQSDINKLQPLGPPVESTTTGRADLMRIMTYYRDKFRRETTLKVGDVELATKNIQRAELTPSTWRLYNDMERKLLETSVKDSAAEHLTPIMDRLAKSGLKAAILIAASRLPDRVIVQEQDIMKAFSYVTMWRGFAMDVVASIGLSVAERNLGAIYNAVLRQPGILRSTLMTKYHLNSRDAEMIFDTLEQRGQVVRTKHGKSESLSPVE
jgi:Protein of unknown function (DUF3987)/RepB DNA-primase from phage plasmid